jgi:hypothetical protein
MFEKRRKTGDPVTVARGKISGPRRGVPRDSPLLTDNPSAWSFRVFPNDTIEPAE